MTIRNRLTFRFLSLVCSILMLTFVSIYAFCWYFISSDFYRRLDRKAYTAGELLIRHRLDAQLVRQLNRIRKDQLPEQRILIFDARDSLIFGTDEAHLLNIDSARLASIRRDIHRDYQSNRYYVSAIRFSTGAGQYIVVAGARNTYGDAFLRRLLWALFGLFCLIAAITGLAGWLFAGDALRPMQQIDDIVSAIFPNNRDERLAVSADDDEISRLSTTINRLLDRVGESFRLQRMFVANVSHELKNPLTQISSQLEVSLLNQRQPEAYRQTIRSVLDDVTQLSALTHELLQLSQVSQDHTAGLLTDRVRIDELVWDIREVVSAMAPRNHVVVTLDDLPDDPDQLTVPGNRTLLATALRNLTENACKFSDDGQALVRVRYTPSALLIGIQNTGPAIPAAELPYIFEPFYRSRQTAGVRGYGVGLSLVERIVRLHGGQIEVQSAAGQPTVFAIWLPR